MKRLLAFFLSILFVFSSYGQHQPSLKADLASKSLLLDITTVGDSGLIAVGERGHILLSADGFSWRQANVPMRATLTSVYFIDALNGWAVGHDATILYSQDGGENWVIQQYLPEKEKPLLDVVFKNALEGIAVGAYGQLYRTNDGGKNWTFEFHDEFLYPEDAEYLLELKNEDEEAYLDEQSSILPHFNRIFKDGRTLYLVGEIGLIAKSNDFAKTWQPFDEIYQGSFNDIKRTQAGNLIIAGLRGNVFRSLKNGTPWQPSETPTTALINSIVLGDDSTVFLLGNNGALLISYDDGVNFSLKTQADGKSLIAGVYYQQQLIVVSDVGVKTISLKNKSAK